MVKTFAPFAPASMLQIALAKLTVGSMLGQQQVQPPFDEGLLGLTVLTAAVVDVLVPANHLQRRRYADDLASVVSSNTRRGRQTLLG